MTTFFLWLLLKHISIFVLLSKHTVPSRRSLISQIHDAVSFHFLTNSKLLLVDPGVYSITKPLSESTIRYIFTPQDSTAHTVACKLFLLTNSRLPFRLFNPPIDVLSMNTESTLAGSFADTILYFPPCFALISGVKSDALLCDLKMFAICLIFLAGICLGAFVEARVTIFFCWLIFAFSSRSTRAFNTAMSESFTCMNKVSICSISFISSRASFCSRL